MSSHAPGGKVGLSNGAQRSSPPEARVSPNTIRAERSEQEVAVATDNLEPDSPYSFDTAGQAGPWHTETFILIAMCPTKSDVCVCVCVPLSACPTVMVLMSHDTFDKEL